MLATRNNTNAKFCKVCQDAGKPESEYKSHFTRESKDPNSAVICPTLLLLECRYCFKSGHTVKYCSVLKQKSASNNKTETINTNDNKKSKPKAQGKPVNTNSFAYLQWDSDEEDTTIKTTFKNEPIEEYPSLTYFKPSYKISSLNYAAALLVPRLEPEPQVVEDNQVKKQIKEKVEMKPAPWSTKPKQDIRNMSWADMESDSEDEDDNSAW